MLRFAQYTHGMTGPITNLKKHAGSDILQTLRTAWMLGLKKTRLYRLGSHWFRVFLLLFLLSGLAACGYHTAGQASRLPADLHTVAIPTFQNSTSAYHIEQVLTEAVVREFLARTHYRVVSQDDGHADAVLHGTVLAIQIYPVTVDSVTGRATSGMVAVTMKVNFADRRGKVLYDNPGYSFHEPYQISREPSSFFQEETPALRRLASEFARTLVSNVLEAY